MKIIIALLLAFVMVFGLVACGGSEDTNESGEKTCKVAFILNCSISDGGWGTACYSELVAAEIQEKYLAYIKEMIDGTFMK